MNTDLLYQKLAHLLKLLKSLPPRVGGRINSRRTNQFSSFMRGTIELYLDVRNNTEALSDSEVQNYLKESENLLKLCINDINYFVYQIEKFLHTEFYVTEQWINICWMRSSVEAIKELYLDSHFEKYLDDIEELDEEIKLKGKFDGFLLVAQILDKLPSSHWWWWLPDTPPSDSREVLP